MTMMTRISSVITQFTFAKSAFGGYPVVLRASLNFASSQPLISISAILVTTSSVVTAGKEANDSPALPRKSLALSQADCRDHGPIKMWKLQSLAVTVIG